MPLVAAQHAVAPDEPRIQAILWSWSPPAYRLSPGRTRL